MSRVLTGMEQLRLAVKNFNYCRESFLDRFSVEELLALHKAWQECGWDIFPDQWEERQVQEALQGKPPKWDDNEEPVYSE